jgi:RES domain-containing protein
MVTQAPGRWNRAGEAAIYLAGDPGLALVEGGRHRPEGPTSRLMVWRVDLGGRRVLDLRRPEVAGWLAVPVDPRWILDRERCAAVAGRARSDLAVEGLVVPSAGALDRMDRWNVVLFIDGDRPGPPPADAVRPALVLDRV